MTAVAVCGVGTIGKVHVANLRVLRGCRVPGIFDVNQAERDRVAALHDTRAYRTLEEMLGDPQVDAVVVATPSSSHRDIACRVLAAGKHVLVEKPLAGTLEDASAIVAAAAKSGRVAQAGFCERFNPSYLEARRAVTSGALGKVRTIHASRLGPYHLANPAWDLGVLDTAVHDIDLILWLMGRRPVAVWARGAQVYPDSPIPHSATIVMSFDDGAMAVDHVAWMKSAGHPLGQCARSRLLIQGDAGSFEVDLGERPASVLDGTGFRQVDTVVIGGTEYPGCLRLQLEHFVRSIEEGAPVLAPLEDALEAERVALAALEALRTGADVQMR